MPSVYITGGSFNGGSGRVRKFDRDGTQLAEFWPSSAAEHGGPPYTGTIYDFTGGDTDSGEALVLVADPANGCVWRFDDTLTILGSFGTGTLTADVTGPSDVCVVGSNAYVCQRADPVLTKWSLAGTLVDSWATDLLTPTALDVVPDGDTVFYISSWGNVRKFVISTSTDSLVRTTSGHGGLRVPADRV